MHIAEAFGDGQLDCDPEVYDDGSWPKVERWAAELGPGASTAAALVTSMPQDGGNRRITVAGRPRSCAHKNLRRLTDD
jgi:hypothetical protein